MGPERGTKRARKFQCGGACLGTQAGDRVTVEISAGRDQFTNSGTDGTDIRRVATVVSGRLGEWTLPFGQARDIGRLAADLIQRRVTAGRVRDRSQWRSASIW